MAASTTAEAIAEYLESLTKRATRSGTRIDREAVKAVKDQLKKASDPITRLNLARELREASQPKQVEPAPHPGLQVFITNARAWAEENGYTAADLQRYAKVPVDVLRAAGFVVPHLAERPTSGTRRRAERLRPDEDVLPVIKQLGDTWRLSELAAKLDRDVATTRNYVNKLVEWGKIEAAGVDASGQGRAATLYRLI